MLRAVLWLYENNGLVNSREFTDLNALQQAWVADMSSVAHGCVDILFDEKAAPRCLRSYQAETPSLYMTFRAASILAGHCTLRVADSLLRREGVSHVMVRWEPRSDAEDINRFLGLMHTSSEFAVRPQRNWVDMFISTCPDDADVLRQHGIIDDDTYRSYEHSLPSKLRVTVGCFRFVSLDSSGASYDTLRTVVPLWHYDQPIDMAILTERVRNVFKYYGIDTWASVLDRSEQQLRQLKNFGTKSMTDLTEVLRRISTGTQPYFEYARTTRNSEMLEEHMSTMDTAVPSLVPSFSSFREAFDAAISALPKSEHASMLLDACGFCTPKLTLQDIASKHALTRERIRQIVERATDHLHRNHPLRVTVLERLEILLSRSATGLSVSGIRAMDPWFDDSFSVDVAYFLCNRVWSSSLQMTSKDEDALILPAIDGLLDDVIGGVATFLREFADAHMPLDIVEEAIAEHFPSVPMSVLQYAIAAHGRYLQTAVNEEDGITYLVGYGSNLEDVIRAVLESSAAPLTVEQIHARIQSMGHSYAYQSVAGHAPRAGIRFGPGLFGVRRHVPLTDAMVNELCQRVTAVLKSDPSRQWHLHEVKSALDGVYNINALGLNDYTVMHFLGESYQIARLGYLSLRLRDNQDSDQSPHRLQIVETMEAVLEEHGGPMSTESLRSELKTRRGVPDSQQLFNMGRVIRLRRGLIGLIDRDLPFVDDDYNALSQAIRHAQVHDSIDPLAHAGIAIARGVLGDRAEHLDDVAIRTLIRRYCASVNDKPLLH